MHISKVPEETEALAPLELESWKLNQGPLEE